MWDASVAQRLVAQSAFGSEHDLGSWDRVPHRAPYMDPASPSAYVSASLPVSFMNK